MTSAPGLNGRLRRNDRLLRTMLNDGPKKHQADEDEDPAENDLNDFGTRRFTPEFPGLPIVSFTDFEGEFHARQSDTEL
jgi:hypothetical protein